MSNSYFQKDAYWYLGPALLKEGRENDALRLIEKSDHQQKAAVLSRLRRSKAIESK